MNERLLAYTLNSLTHKGSGGNEKLPPCRFPTVGIVLEIRRASTQLPPQTTPPWWCRLPRSYGVLTMDALDRTRATPSEEVRQEHFGLV